MRTFFNDKYHFNPHSRKGSDLEHKEQIQASRNFNPHSRKGSDVTPSEYNLQKIDFNPHSRKGSDYHRVSKVCL